MAAKKTASSKTPANNEKKPANNEKKPAKKAKKAKNAKTPASNAKKKSTPAAAILAVVAEAKLATNANKKRAQLLLDLIARRAVRMTEDFYEVGKALKELSDRKLHVALGFASFEAMLDAHGVIGITQARKLIEVVSRVPLSTALELGLEKAFALTRYADATPEPDTPELLATGGTIGGEPIAKVGRRAIEEETKRLRQKAAEKKGLVDPARKEAEKVAKRGLSWLKARGAKKGAVEARRTKQGHLIAITLPVAEASKLFER